VCDAKRAESVLQCPWLLSYLQRNPQLVRRPRTPSSPTTAQRGTSLSMAVCSARTASRSMRSARSLVSEISLDKVALCVSEFSPLSRHFLTTPCPGEMLWTDPQTAPGRGPSKRGVGIAFGPDVTKHWCELNKVSGIIRSHEVRQGMSFSTLVRECRRQLVILDGYEIEHNGLCTTVFSAPNYVDQSGNKGAFVSIFCQFTMKRTLTLVLRFAWTLPAHESMCSLMPCRIRL